MTHALADASAASLRHNIDVLFRRRDNQLLPAHPRKRLGQELLGQGNSAVFEFPVLVVPTAIDAGNDLIPPRVGRPDELITTTLGTLNIDIQGQPRCADDAGSPRLCERQGGTFRDGHCARWKRVPLDAAHHAKADRDHDAIPGRLSSRCHPFCLGVVVRALRQRLDQTWAGYLDAGMSVSGKKIQSARVSRRTALRKGYVAPNLVSSRMLARRCHHEWHGDVQVTFGKRPRIMIGEVGSVCTVAHTQR